MRSLATALVFLAVLLGAASAYADVSAPASREFKHRIWGVDEGAPAAVQAITQSRDGYLWLAAQSGLYRFDGVTFDEMPHFGGGVARSDNVTAILASKAGDIWVGHFWGGLSIYKAGKLQDANPAPPHGILRHIVEDRDGVIWTASDGAYFTDIRRYDHGKWDIVTADWGLPKEHFGAMLAARDGTLWVALSRHILKLPHGARHFIVMQAEAYRSASLAEAPDGSVWMTDDRGLRSLTADQGTGTRPVQLINAGSIRFPAFGLIFDRDGSLWSTDLGSNVIHIGNLKQDVTEYGRDTFQPEAGAFSAAEREKFGIPLSVYEDREGNIWVGGGLGIARLRPTDVTTYQRALSTKDSTSGVFDAHNGIVYGNVSGTSSLFAAAPGKPMVPLHNIPGEYNSLCKDRQNGLWFGTLTAGLEHFVDGHASAVPRPLGTDAGSMDICAVDRFGRVWVSFGGIGLYRYDGAAWTRFDLSPELKGLWPWVMTADQAGRILVYFGTRSLMRVDGDHVETVWAKKDISIGFINTIVPGRDGVLLGGDSGVAKLGGDGIRVLGGDRFPFLRHVSGFAQTAGGQTWLMGASGLARLPTTELDAAFSNPLHALKPVIYDSQEGISGIAQIGAHGSDVVEGGDGRIWFATNDGISSIDPAHLHRNALAPIVLIRAVVMKSKSYPAQGQLTLPEGASAIEIDYTATSLQRPERVQFRYKLEGVDSDWVDPGRRRQAFYTNIAPGTYRFRAIAANNDGVWNTTGASLTFTIPPTFLQSRLFAVLCILVLFFLAFLLYSLRMRQISDRLRLRLEERLTERERIARELHDTLLQGFQALVIRLQNMADKISTTETGRELIEQELERADAVLIEGRNRVRNLRTAGTGADLTAAFHAAAQDHLVGSSTKFVIEIDGEPHALAPTAFEEIAKIGSEALSNAFRHASAEVISVRLGYKNDQFCLTISDDGQGISREVLQIRGRDGHFGLIGMRERADHLKGALSISSVPGKGTNITLSVPGFTVYAARKPHRLWQSAFRKPVGMDLL